MSPNFSFLADPPWEILQLYGQGVYIHVYMFDETSHFIDNCNFNSFELKIATAQLNTHIDFFFYIGTQAFKGNKLFFSDRPIPYLQ